VQKVSESVLTMAFLSFALTTKEFLAGIKTVTRRAWKKRHFENWCKWWDQGKRVHDAWDKVPFAGGKKIGRFEMTCRPYLERLANMPESDLIAEGGMCKTLEEYYTLVGKKPEDIMAVVRLKKIEE
jgi:hypothetical protein